MEHQGSLQHSERANHFFLPSDKLIQSMPSKLTPLRSILTLFFHLNLGFPSGHSPSGLPTKTQLSVSLLPLTCHMPHPSYPPCL